MKKWTVTVLLVSILMLLVACNDKLSEQKQEVLQKYAIVLDISEDLLTAELRTTISYYNDTENDLNEIKFRLYPNTYQEDSPTCAYFSQLSKYGEITINEVSIAGVPATYDAVETVLCVALASPLPPQKEIEISINCTLDIPESDLRLGLHNNVLRLAHFYPVLCVYENGAWRTDEFYKVGNPFYHECAEYAVTVLCKENLTVASTGKTVSEIKNGEQKTVTIEAKGVRDFGLMLSENFKIAESKHGDTVIRYYYTDNGSKEAELAAATSAIEIFSDTVGIYPYPVYTIVESDFYYGSAGFGNLAMISTSSADTEKLVIYETAQQWFGNMVGNDNINHCWQNEALSAFLANYYYYLKENKKSYEEQKGNDRKEYLAFQTSRQNNSSSCSFDLNRTVYQFTTNYEYGMVIHKKGSMMFDAVLDIVGKDRMNKALNAYYHDYAYSVATAEQMLASFDQATDRKVSALVRSWLDEKTIISGVITNTPSEEV